MHFSTTSAILFSINVFLLFFKSGSAVNGKVRAVFAFGDSILDTGNNNQIPSFLKSNAPPYGRDFPGGKATGRFCNGKLLDDLIAEGLGVKGILPAFLDPNLRDNDLPTGVCFASAGSGLDPLTSSTNRVLSMEDQLNLFKDYISKLKRVVGEQRANSIISNSLFLISAGNNDVALTYYTLRYRPYDISSYGSQLATWASDFIKNIYNLGARRIAFMSTLPLGCLPSARTMGGGYTRACAFLVNYGAQVVNAKMSSELGNLNNNLAGSKIFFLDVYTPYLDLIQNPQASGFREASRGCCGSGTYEMGVAQCQQSCSDPSEFVFWDVAHPSERANRIVASQLLKKYSSSFSA